MCALYILFILVSNHPPPPPITSPRSRFRKKPGLIYLEIKIHNIYFKYIYIII